MGLHIIRGLNILREYRARPYLNTNGLMPARHSGLPSLDVFIIKLFAAPCRFTEQQTSESSSIMTPPVETRSDRKLAPNMRAELTKVATLTIALLERTTKFQSAEQSQSLILERRDLLDNLDLWLCALESLQKETQPGEPESISDNFLRILYLILKIILLGTLETSPELDTKLRDENKQLQGLANLVNERLKDYDMRRGIDSSLAKQSQ